MSDLTSEEFAEGLKEVGLWKEFRALRQTLEAGGLSKKESYREARNQFVGGKAAQGGSKGPSQSSPLPHPVSKSTKKLLAKAKVFKGKSSSLKQDYQWVYDNCAVADVKPEDAPSAGSWGLLMFAQTDPKSFYVEWMRMVSRQESSDEVMEGFKDDAGRATAEIADMLRSLADASVRGGPEGGNGEPSVSEVPTRKSGKRQKPTARSVDGLQA